MERQYVTWNLGQENDWSQIATSSKNDNNKHRAKKYLPYVFTEQGIAMLSGLLKNDIAIQVSINIMNAFVEIYAHVPNSAYKLFYKKSAFAFCSFCFANMHSLRGNLTLLL